MESNPNTESNEQIRRVISKTVDEIAKMSSPQFMRALASSMRLFARQRGRRVGKQRARLKRTSSVR
jgi:hypothetical protein